jgi:hypothetical protein
MAFDKDGSLVVCIAGMGLYRIDKMRSLQRMTTETNRSRLSVIDDSRLRLADDLDIAHDGKIYFSEATIRYGMEEWVVDALEGRGNGRIIRHDPATRQQVGAVCRNLGLSCEPLLAGRTQGRHHRDRFADSSGIPRQRQSRFTRGLLGGSRRHAHTYLRSGHDDADVQTTHGPPGS